MPETQPDNKQSNKRIGVSETEQEDEVTCVPETDSEEERIPATPQKKSFKSIAFDDLESTVEGILLQCSTPHL